MTAQEAARLIDISAVRTAHTLPDIVNIVNIAKEYRFINVHSLPCWTATVRELLAGEPDIYAGAPVGFPGGAHKTEIKLLEAEHLIKDGVQEMDIVMNVGRFKNREYDYVLDELRQIVAVTPKQVRTKVIIEINALTDAEIDKACELVPLSGAEFIKTGTGWIPGPVNIPRIARIRELTRGRIKVKASGGIRTRDEFEQLAALGVERFGINLQSALEIVSSYPKS
ncbi:MAG: deoxyribose-phosphate aldolase [Treponema sp.]|jgi:deoxyribose-phosphate aldolase|nr:deoxyribose-phosphate aldolase [Treponema sp.]